jgi:hypothetical protein
MKPCPQCEGDGVCAYEEAVADYEHGGYLEEVYGECDMCWGSGEVEDDDDPEDISGPYSAEEIEDLFSSRTIEI